MDAQLIQLVNTLQDTFSNLGEWPSMSSAFDQVLKDEMLRIAEMDQENGEDGMLGEEGDAEIATIMGRVYKVRPFGLPASNMRNLNPSGE